MNCILLDWKSFPVKLDKVGTYFKAHLSSNYDGLIANDELSVVFLDEPSTDDVQIVSYYWSSLISTSFNPTPTEIVTGIINEARIFGMDLIVNFATENVLLGITQMGMTGQVRKATAEVVSALNTGSLYDAITEARAIPAEDKDSRFVTNARLLSFINKIEAHLGITLSTSL